MLHLIHIEASESHCFDLPKRRAPWRGASFLLRGWPAYCYPVRPGHTLDGTSRKLAIYSVYKVPSYKSWNLNFPSVWDERMQGQT